MMETTLCYIIKDNQVLMLHRIKKKDDYNQGKWIGIGGKIENETITDCLLREVKEETGLTLEKYTFFGKVLFHQGDYHETMYLYRGDKYHGSLTDSDEGVLAFIPLENIFELTLWPGDIIFLKRLLANEPFDTLELYYEDEKLKDYQFK